MSCEAALLIFFKFPLLSLLSFLEKPAYMKLPLPEIQHRKCCMTFVEK